MSQLLPGMNLLSPVPVPSILIEWWDSAKVTFGKCEALFPDYTFPSHQPQQKPPEAE